jgi:hypothetical protein
MLRSGLRFARQALRLGASIRSTRASKSDLAYRKHSEQQTLRHFGGDGSKVVGIRDVVVAGILAGRENAAKSVSLIDGPGDDEDIGPGQRADSPLGGSGVRLRSEPFGPGNISEAGESGGG